MIQPNFLYPISFGFVLSKTPTTNYFIQRATIPGLTLGNIDVPTPRTVITEPGNIQYDQFRVGMLVNEDLTAYLEIVNWMIEKGNPYTSATYNSQKYDAKLVVMNSANRPIIDITFEDVFPTSITPIDLDIAITEPTPVIADVSFSYDVMRFN